MKGDFLPGDHGMALALQDLATPEGMQDCALRLIGNSPGMQNVRELICRVAPDRLHRADLRRVRLRQGTRRRIHPRHEPARATRPFVATQLRGDPGDAHRGRAVRPRARQLHRRRCARARACSSAPTAARCSSTRSPRCRSTCRSRLLRVLETGALQRVGGSTHRARRRARHRRDQPRRRAGGRRRAGCARTSTTGSRS